MNKREFIQKASIQIAAALVKAYDETAEGLLDDIENRSKELASNATTLAFDLAERLETNYTELYREYVFDYD